MDLLETELSYKFRDPELLQQALTHTTLQTPTSSPFNIRKRTCDHLKLLGDAVLKLLTTQYAICVAPPNDKVHNVVQVKESISSRRCQSLVGRLLQLEKKGIVVSNLPSDQICNHLDTFVKSIFGAIFLDAGGSEKKGFISSWKVFLKLWKPVISCLGEARQLVNCFPEPKYSSQDFLKERFTNFKAVDLKLLEEKIGFKFLKHPHLLEQAMTHDSIDLFTNSVNSDARSPEFVHFQTLEFLGDSVLELVIMEYLYLRSSSADPLGQMLFFNKDTSQKLVSSRFQIQVANKLKLGEFVIKPPQVGLASYDDFVESLIGSIYIHAKAIGLRVCAKVVLGIWGLEPSLEEEDDKKDEQENQHIQLNGTENITSKAKTANDTELQMHTASPATISTPKVKVCKPSAIESLQSLLNYSFVNARLLNCLPVKNDPSTTETGPRPVYFININTNLQVIGKRAIELIATEYVIGICHSSKTADLNAETKQSVTKLIEDLSSDKLENDIFTRFQLSKYFDLQDQKFSASDLLNLIFGAVFIDSTGDLIKIQKLFLRFWGNYTNGTRPDPLITHWFPDTSEKQQIFREAINAKISEEMWKKLYTLLGHSFTNKNLLEQALTDEKSQGYAKQQHNAYPLGNPFALQILGKRIIDLFAAQRCYLNTLPEPFKFQAVLERFDQSLFNTLKNRFTHLERYYANHKKYPFPPTKKPRAPFESMIAALYLDVGGGTKGLQQIRVAVMKANPNLLELKNAKGVKEAAQNSGDDCNISISVDGGKKNKEIKSPTQLSDLNSSKLLNPPVSFSKNMPVELNTSLDSQEEGITESHLQNRVLSKLQKKLTYKFVNPLHLRIVLEVEIPREDDNENVSSSKYFEMFKILGKRALNLLATEFALESMSVPKNCNISEEGKKQVEIHIAYLKSSPVMDMVANVLELKNYVTAFPTNAKSTPSNEDYITAMIGAVFIDSRANYLKVYTLFNKLWKSSIDPNQTQFRILQCFPSTTEAQQKLRSATSVFHTDCKWRKLYRKLGYAFKKVNLLEQALTDENSQELARTKHHACPTGNPFALRLLGRCVIELVIAYKTLPTGPRTNTEMDSYVTSLDTFEKALFNSFVNNFLGVQKYYACARQKKVQPFPPKNYPLGPYEAIMGAVYVDSSAGNPGLDAVGVVIVNRNIGIKGNDPVNGIVVNGIVPTPHSIESGPSSPLGAASKFIPIEPVVSCSSPVPSTSSALSDSMNSPFSSKCAANFSISPAQIKNKSPLKPISSPTPESATIAPIVTSLSPQSPTLLASPTSPPQNEKELSKLDSPPKSKKKKNKQAASLNSPPNSPQKEEESITLPSPSKLSKKESELLASASSPKSTKTKNKQVASPTEPPSTSPQNEKQSSTSASPPKSPKKQSQQPTATTSSPKKQQKTYASVLINGEPVKPDNKLLIAVTNAQSQIQALQKKQESKEHYRKLSMEKEKLQLQDHDQISTTSSSRSRCPSTSTINSIGSQSAQQNEPGQKRKRGGKAGKKQNKKTKAAQAQPPSNQVVPSTEQATSRRVSAWCQNQIDKMPPSSSPIPIAGGSSLCTDEVHQQRSMVHQLQDIKGQQGDQNKEFSQFSSTSSSTDSSYNAYVPKVNTVCDYHRHPAIDDDGYATGSGSDKKCKQNQKQTSESTSITNVSEATDPPPSGFSYMGVLKWTSIVLGMAFLLTRYSQGKK